MSIDNPSSIEVEWPFYRYHILTSKEIDGNAWEWLYISLVRAFNTENKRVKNMFDEQVLKKVEAFIKSDLSGMMGPDDVSSVKDSVMRHYVKGGVISDNAPDVFSHQMDTFSRNMESWYIYQDAVTGSVLPYFYHKKWEPNVIKCIKSDKGMDEDPDVIKKDSESVHMSVSDPKTQKRPDDDIIRLAYSRFRTICKLKDANEFLMEKEYIDEHVEDLLNHEHTNTSDAAVSEIRYSKSNIKRINNMRIDLDEDKDIFSLLFKISISDYSYEIESPFKDTNTDVWMRKCFENGDSNNEVHRIKEKISPKKRIDAALYQLRESKNNGEGDFFYYFKDAYEHLIDSGGTDEMLILAINMESKFNKFDKLGYVEVSKLMEALINSIHYSPTPDCLRSIMDYPEFEYYIDKSMISASVDYDRLKTRGIFDDWKKIQRGQNPIHHSFKSIMADICMRTELPNTGVLKKDSIKTMFEVFDIRNSVAHYNSSTNGRILSGTKQDQVSKINESIKILCEIKKKGL